MMTIKFYPPAVRPQGFPSVNQWDNMFKQFSLVVVRPQGF
jgi:hypothetical protein